MTDISICMVAYNHRDYIAQAIDSVFAQQTDYSYEIIVGDDCSPDGTAQYVKEQYGDRVILIEHEKNVGLTRNMYDILTMCKGRYIYTCAGDDWICDPTMIQKHVEFLDTHPEYSSVTNWRMTVDIHGNKMYDGKIDHTEFTLQDFLLKKSKNDGGMGTIRNYFLDSEEDFSFLYKCSRNNEELPLSILVFERGKHYIIPENMIAYRHVMQEGKTNYNSTHNMVQRFEESYYCIQKLREFYPVHNYDGMEIRYVYMYFYPILRTLSLKQISRYFRIIGWKWVVKLLWLGPIMFFNGKELPKFIVREIY